MLFMVKFPFKQIPNKDLRETKFGIDICVAGGGGRGHYNDCGS